MNTRKIIRDTFFLNLASLTLQGLAVIQSILILKFLDPEKYGIWLGLNIILTYGNYVSLGLEHGMGVRLPYYQGANNFMKVSQIQDTSYLAWSGLSLLTSIAILGYAILWPNLTNLIRTGLVIIGLMMFFEQQVSFLTRWLTNARKDFEMYSKLTIVRGLMAFFMIIPSAYLFNVQGVMLATGLVSAISLLVWFARIPYRFQREFNREALWELFRVGFPIYLVVLCGSLIETVDRMLILAWLGPVSLGYYGITTFGGNSLYRLLAQAGSAMSPHMAEEMGKTDDKVLLSQAMEKYLLRPTYFFAGLITVMIMGLTVMLPPVIRSFIPKYIPGLPAFYLYVPGFFFLGIIISANTIFNLSLIAQKKQHIAVLIQVITIAVELLAGALFIKIGWGITGVALASTLAYAIYGLTILFQTSKYVLNDKRARSHFLAYTLAPLIYAVPVMYGIINLGKFLYPDRLFLQTGINAALSIIAILPIIWWAKKITGFVNILEAFRNRQI